jgi:hypothetical protein
MREEISKRNFSKTERTKIILENIEQDRERILKETIKKIQM